MKQVMLVLNSIDYKGTFVAWYPGIPKSSENIEVISIIDRFLEHSRLFIFCNNSNEKYYLASADWMSRNLMNRIECAFPIYDHDLQKILRNIFDLQWNDPLKARIIDGVKDTLFKQSEKSKMKSSSQQLTYEYLKS
jgi:polyphosphate kinase